MARRNKKKHRQNGIILPIPFGGIVVLLSSLAIGYVWMDCRCGAIGAEIKQFEKDRSALHKTHLNEQCRWAKLKSPRSIEAALREHRIAMSLPRRDQIVVMRDSGAVEALLQRDERAGAATVVMAGMVMNE